MTNCAAGQMSTPVPSPSTNGMMGSSGTDSVPSACVVIFSGMSPTLVAAEIGLDIRRRAVRRADRCDRLGRGRHRLGVETRLVERLLDKLRLHDDLDPAVLGPAFRAGVGRDEVLRTPATGIQAALTQPDGGEVVVDR